MLGTFLYCRSSNVFSIKRKPGFLSLNENENKRPRTVSGLLTSNRKQPTLDDMAVVKQTSTTLSGFVSKSLCFKQIN